MFISLKPGLHSIKLAALIGATSTLIACGGGGSSSGGSSANTVAAATIIPQVCLPSFTATDCAAFLALNAINPRSQAENCEYGGIVYEDSEGMFGSDNLTKGTSGNVFIRGATNKGIGISRFHTHPGNYSDDFSALDKAGSRRDRINQYLATGNGNFKRYDYLTDTTVTLSRISTTQNPPLIVPTEDRCMIE